jgi:TrpR family trp operon transcriptional repressor
MKRHSGHPHDLRNLARVLAEMSAPGDIADVFKALLTPAEREKLALRWRLVRMLEQGMSQRAIAGALGVSLCKITRGSRELKCGPPAFRRAVRRAVQAGDEQDTDHV